MKKLSYNSLMVKRGHFKPKIQVRILSYDFIFFIIFDFKRIVGRVVKATDLRSVGRKSAWVRTPHYA